MSVIDSAIFKKKKKKGPFLIFCIFDAKAVRAIRLLIFQSAVQDPYNQSGIILNIRCSRYKLLRNNTVQHFCFTGSF